jgi:ABC-type Fe3+-hydroxamate transport system substrate-binding protein
MKNKVLLLILAGLAGLLLAGCLGQEQDEPPPESVPPEESQAAAEDLEYPVEFFGAALESRPGAVVSLSPALTEKLHEMGFDDRLEGCSDYDEFRGDKIACGTAQTPDVAAIKEIAPHLLFTEIELPDDDAQELRDSGVEIAVIPHAASFTELLGNYQSMAMLMDGKKTGAALGGAYCEVLNERMRALEQNALGEPKVAVYLAQLDYTMATGDTLESELMEKVGFVNIAKEQKGWEYPEDEANAEADREKFRQIDFIYCDRDSVTMPMMEKSEFWRGLNCVLKDYYLYIDSTAFDLQTGRMLDELERMVGYANGEVEGGAIQEQQAQDSEGQADEEPEEEPAE